MVVSAGCSSFGVAVVMTWRPAPGRGFGFRSRAMYVVRGYGRQLRQQRIIQRLLLQLRHVRESLLFLAVLVNHLHRQNVPNEIASVGQACWQAVWSRRAS